MFTKLFHKDVYVPNGMQAECKSLQRDFGSYFLSRHFQEHIDNQGFEDRSHTYLPDVIDACLKTIRTTQYEAFEVEYGKDYHKFGQSGFFVTKYCIRIPYSKTEDLVIAIRPQYEGTKVKTNMIVTAWMNSASDHHFTLDASKYCSKDEWLKTF